ncbi:MAG: hypothetical protein QM731_03015 [Chitinophagaceae bacterium]
MFADYELLVLQCYQEKRDANALSPRLLHLKPANLRDECEAVYEKRYDRKDDGILWAFFEEKGDSKACLHAIKDCETGKFKPLINFLNGVTKTTDEKNIELLAWLIDFEDRPFKLGRIYATDSPVVPGSIEKQTQEEENSRGELALMNDPEQHIDSEDILVNSETISVKDTQKSKKRRVIIITVILFLALSAGGYWLWRNKSPLFVLKGNGGCMYWAGDHYEPVSCFPGKDTLAVPLDSQMLKNLRRITDTASITLNSIGSVWYVKIDKQVEFYTSGGFHPIYTKLRLRPITRYIIDKYLPPKQ